MTDFLKPEIDTINQPYWTALEAGDLVFQRCVNAHAWLPPRAQCPHCLSAEWSWQKARGTGRIKSWVVYHQAYHPSFADRVPYNVAIVELDEGPRLITNILAANDALKAEAKVKLSVDRRSGAALACFALASE